MKYNIEDTIHEDSLPINTIAMANRLIEILKENETNCALSLKKEGKEQGLIQYLKCLWIINQQVYGQLETIDMNEEWVRLNKLIA